MQEQPLRYAPAVSAFDSTAIPQTRWLEGGLIGGVTLGLGVGLLYSAICDRDAGNGQCNTAPVALTAAALGFVIGALIGGAVPKNSGP
jgi:Na+/glutamate symporter